MPSRRSEPSIASNRCLRDRPPIVRPLGHRVEHLGRDHDLIARGELLQRAAEDLLADAARIHVGGVEEVDAVLERALDERTAGGFVEHPRPPLRRAVGHRAEAEARDLQAGSAEPDVVHGGDSDRKLGNRVIG